MEEITTQLVFSVDEVGRGPLWGPVTAAAVVLPTECPDNNPLWNFIKDSKKVTEKKRPIVAEYIKSIALTYGIGTADAEEIDEVNILQATMRAMHRALDMAWRKWQPELGPQPDTIHVDGPHFIPYTPPGMDAEALDHICLVNGDATDKGIGAASILAKVHRDEWIELYVKEHPEVAPYHLDKNKGYGTAEHMKALKTAGVHHLHRMSFGPVTRAAAAAAAPEDK